MSCLFIVVSINVANEHTFNFLSEFVLAADKVLIVGDFNIHVYNKKYALGSTFIDMLNSIGARQHVSGPTHCQNHTLMLMVLIYQIII